MSKRSVGVVGVVVMVSIGLSGCFQSYTIEDCIPLMESYGELTEDTAHFLCGSLYHSSTQEEFNAAIGEMQAAIRDGRTMQDDLQSGIDSYFSDLGIAAPDLGN